MKYIKDWKKSLNINERFSWATNKQRKQILAEIKYQREQKNIQIKTLITQEMVIAQKEGQPTSRLTSLFNKIKD